MKVVCVLKEQRLFSENTQILKDKLSEFGSIQVEIYPDEGYGSIVNNVPYYIGPKDPWILPEGTEVLITELSWLKLFCTFSSSDTVKKLIFIVIHNGPPELLMMYSAFQRRLFCFSKFVVHLRTK